VAWKLTWAIDDVKSGGSYAKVLYHPFDWRWCYFTGKSSGLMARPRMPESQHLLKKNIALLAVRNTRRSMINNYFITNTIVDKDGISSFDNCRFFPLYLYPTDGEEQLGESRKPNLDEKIWRKIDKCTKLETTPEQIFDYIYGVLHTPSYREKYKEFLKIDFPRIPYPENKEEFERIVSIGNKLRKLHLMEEIPPQATSFDIEGDNAVSEIRFEKEKVYINKTQYFANVPELAWNFYIGGYQPAQKWLKDRKNRTLTFDDISHYRKIIAILIETHKLMLELDKKA
jgi:predicted helicase